MKRTTKRRIRWGVAALAGFLLGAMAFVFYFLHSVYEVEDYLESQDVPGAVQQSFADRFPGAADTRWKLADGQYEAMFTWQGKEETEAYYEPDGSWSKSEYPIEVTDLPPKARAFLQSHKWYKVMAVEQVEERDSNVAFEAELANLLLEYDCLFDEDGELISKTRDGSALEEQDIQE